MKFYNDVLSDSTLHSIFKDRKEKYDTLCWGIGTLTWQKELLDGMYGCCYAAHVSDEVRDRLLSDIEKFLPTFKNINLLHYVWDQGSGIGYHSDGKFKFGATIYLNREWNINEGGIFIWENGKELCAKVPKFNSLVVNDNSTYHLVTSVSNKARNTRNTIQIWCID